MISKFQHVQLVVQYILLIDDIIIIIVIIIIIIIIIIIKLTKYKDLEIEIEKTWGMKTTTVPVIIGAFGLVKKGTENYIGKILGTIRITELQKTVLLGTAHILRRTLSIK